MEPVELNYVLASAVLFLCNKPVMTATDRSQIQQVAVSLGINTVDVSDRDLCANVVATLERGQQLPIDFLPNDILFHIFQGIASQARTIRQLANDTQRLLHVATWLVPLVIAAYKQRVNYVIREAQQGECNLQPYATMNFKVSNSAGMEYIKELSKSSPIRDICSSIPPSDADPTGETNMIASTEGCIRINYRLGKGESNVPYNTPISVTRDYISPKGYFTAGDILQMICDFYLLPMNVSESKAVIQTMLDYSNQGQSLVANNLSAVDVLERVGFVPREPIQDFANRFVSGKVSPIETYRQVSLHARAEASILGPVIEVSLYDPHYMSSRQGFVRRTDEAKYGNMQSLPWYWATQFNSYAPNP